MYASHLRNSKVSFFLSFFLSVVVVGGVFLISATMYIGE